MKKIITLLVLVLALSSCTTRIGDFTVISTKSIDWSRANTFKRAGSRTEGKDIVHWIICIPTGVPSLEEAVDNAIESVPGTIALLDTAVYTKFWWIPYIYGQQGYIIEGTPLIDPSLAQLDLEDDIYRISFYDEDNEMITKVVSEEEFNRIRTANSLN